MLTAREEESAGGVRSFRPTGRHVDRASNERAQHPSGPDPIRGIPSWIHNNTTTPPPQVLVFRHNRFDVTRCRFDDLFCENSVSCLALPAGPHGLRVPHPVGDVW